MPSFSYPDDLDVAGTVTTNVTTGYDPNSLTITTGTANQMQQQPTPAGALMGGLTGAAGTFVSPTATWSTPPDPQLVNILGIDFTQDDVKILRRLLTAFKKHGLPAVSKDEDMEQAIKEAVEMVK